MATVLKMNFWIFQGNPKVFDVDGYLMKYSILDWLVRQKQYGHMIHPGDPAFIWRAKGGMPGSGGIIAKGVILEDPELRDTDTPHTWYVPPEEPIELRVKIKIEEYRLDSFHGMVTKKELEVIPNLKENKIFHFYQATNFQLSQEEFNTIMDRWKKKSRR